MPTISLGNILSEDDNIELGAFIIATLAQQLEKDHRNLTIVEVATLHNITLGYPADQQAPGLRGERDGKRFIFLDATLPAAESQRQFYLLLATFIWEDESKANLG